MTYSVVGFAAIWQCCLRPERTPHVADKSASGEYDDLWVSEMSDVGLPPGRGRFGRRFIQPDYRLPYRPSQAP